MIYDNVLRKLLIHLKRTISKLTRHDELKATKYVSLYFLYEDSWIPAFAGMTTCGLRDLLKHSLYGNMTINVREGLYSKITRGDELK